MITILIVDDEKLERRGIRFLLKREEGEFQILEATNGKDALGVLESNHVDILFSDVKMPYMNGLELTKAVREDHPDMEIVIFSGYNDFSYAREALRYGVVDYVLKPVDPEEFHKTFQRVMENISSKIEKFTSEKSDSAGIIFHHIAKVTNTADICIDVDLTAIRRNIFFSFQLLKKLLFFCFFLHSFFGFLPHILLRLKDNLT